jgi:hypothetical protein
VTRSSGSWMTSTSHSYYDEDPYEDGEYVPVRVFWDSARQQWGCRCASFVLRGKCGHLVRWRKKEDVFPLDRYL